MKWLPRVATALLVVAFIAASGVGGWFYWDRVQERGAEAARNELMQLAPQQMSQVFGYDYQTVETSLTDAYSMLTPEYKQVFEQQANNTIIPEARERQVVAQADVVGVGMLDAHRNSARVLVYLNRTITDQSREPVYEGSRLEVEYQRVDGKWLISYITPI